VVEAVADLLSGTGVPQQQTVPEPVFSGADR
jgi:hypothetical protein